MLHTNTVFWTLCKKSLVAMAIHVTILSCFVVRKYLLVDIQNIQPKVNQLTPEYHVHSKLGMTNGSPRRDNTSRAVRYVGIDADDVFDNRSVQFLVERGLFEPESDQMSEDTKIILWYTPTKYHPRLARFHPLRGCPEKRCRVTTNRLHHEKSDAVIFTAQLLKNIPPKKLPNQTWILHNHESPHWVNRKTYPLYHHTWRSLFNWTLTYREDSDIVDPYAVFKKANGKFLKRNMTIFKNYTSILWNKNKGDKPFVAWMASNCNTMSKRRKYINEMRKYIKIDVFGRCGSSQCPRNTNDACLNLISRNYKFYLGFENSFCKDYITEKLFHFYKSDMVTVVRGGGNYSRVVPPGTYINTADFKAPKQLAEYLITLNRDDNKYLNILKEKDKYEPIMEEWPTVKGGEIVFMNYRYDAAPMCTVCDRLWNLDKYRKHYVDIGKWFSNGLCSVPNDKDVKKV